MNSDILSQRFQLATVPFRGQTLITIKQDETEFAAMRPIVEGMGLDWTGQQKKLTNQQDKFNCRHMSTVAEDGKKREMLCIPLRKLNGWLFTINPAKIKPEIREKVIQYQEECFEALHDYWHTGHALSPRQQPQLPAPTLSPAHQRELQKKISEKVYAVSGNRRQRDQLFPQIQRDFKDHFRIQSYKDLPDDQFDLALGWVDGYVFEGDPPRLAVPNRVVFNYPIECQYDAVELRAFETAGCPSIVVQTAERLLAKQKTSPLRRLLAQITTERLGDVEGCMEELDNIYYHVRLINSEQHNLRMLLNELMMASRHIDYAANSVERLRNDGRAILIQGRNQSQKEVV